VRHTPLGCPCVTFVPVEVESLPSRIERPDLLVTSPRSVVVAARFAEGRRVHSLAPRTAGELDAAGVVVHRRLRGGVADLLVGLGPESCVLLTSDLGAQAARVRWPEMIAVATHRTVAVDWLPPEAPWAMDGRFHLFFASPSAVDAFDRLAPRQLVRAERVLCHGGSTLARARQLGAIDAEILDLGD
jgi:uroporphyrinogen-III synthase